MVPETALSSKNGRYKIWQLVIKVIKKMQLGYTFLLHHLLNPSRCNDVSNSISVGIEPTNLFLSDN